VTIRFASGAYRTGRIFTPMADVRVTCTCGAIYEVIKTEGPSRDQRPFKCVLCDRELFAWEGDNVGQLRLVWRPDEDRE
jgi:hypothetical protein